VKGQRSWKHLFRDHATAEWVNISFMTLSRNWVGEVPLEFFGASEGLTDLEILE
jgi:hypothetical protein